jgi:hypothetical protein
VLGHKPKLYIVENFLIKMFNSSILVAGMTCMIRHDSYILDLYVFEYGASFSIG